MSEDDDDLATVVVGEHPAAFAEVAEQDWPLDELCAAAVDLARNALLEEVDGAQVGTHLHTIAEGPHVVTHYFLGAVPGYEGWRWAVTVTRAPDSDHVTVDETALLPDSDALLAPAWVPWNQRIRSGDLGAGDVLVTEPDDPRLVPGMNVNDLPDDEDDEVRPTQWELGLGRTRVLSPEGRREAAHRWYREVGPRSPIARAADLSCATCGFLMLIGGPLGQAFGVCANGFSPVDGRVVAMTFGCGAHSETVEKPASVTDIVIDEVGYDEMPLPADEESPQEQTADDAAHEHDGDPQVADDDPQTADDAAHEHDGDPQVAEAGDEQAGDVQEMPAETSEEDT